MPTCSQTIAESGIKFGTSGARGLVADFTPLACHAFTFAFIKSMQQDYAFNRVLVGIDNRPSSPDIARYCISALKVLGIQAVYCGVLPTPALALASLQENVPCIMVTGSHIPFDRNGLKFYTPEGEITKAHEQAILSCTTEFAGCPAIALPDIETAATARYIERATRLFAPDVFAGKRIGIYEHSSAGRELYAPIFEALGAEVIALERSDEFVPIDTEAVSEEDKAKARAWSEAHQFDMIFSTDGDGDRPLIGDEKGEWLRGDIVGLLTAKALQVEALAVPVSCNTAIEASQAFSHVTRTKIGSPYVIEAFASLDFDYHSVAGFEANGGFLLGSDVNFNDHTIHALPTRDALLPGILILAEACAQQTTISQLVAALPQRFTDSDRIKEFATERSQELIKQLSAHPRQLITAMGVSAEVEQINTVDGLRITLNTGDIVHLRPSGNAPELRCYAESNSQDLAKQLVLTALCTVQSL
jgi:phosphomannomutase